MKSIEIGEITVEFNERKNIEFVKRLEKFGNAFALSMLEEIGINKGVKCNGCKEYLPLYRFGQSKNTMYLGKCIQCCHYSKCHFMKLFGNIKHRNKTKFNCDPDFDVEHLKALFRIQDGKCAISKYTMYYINVKNTPSAVSVERIDNAKPYLKNNIVLVCVCFQVGQGYNFTPHVMRDILLYSKNGDNFNFNAYHFKRDAYKIRTSRRNKISIVFDMDRRSKVCTECGIMKSIKEYHRRLNSFKPRCKQCDKIIHKERKNTIRGFIQDMVCHAKYSAKRRGNIIRTFGDTSCEVAPNLFDLIVELVIRQGGRCLYTGIPFVFKSNHKYAPSLDRICNNAGYVDGNIQLIVIPLNTPLKPTLEEFQQIRNAHQVHCRANV